MTCVNEIEKGVRFESNQYGTIDGWRPDRLCKSVVEAADGPYSYVLITTKAIPELTKTSHVLAPFLSKDYNDRFPQPTYVLMQNGLNVENELYSSLRALGRGDPRIISTGVWINTNLVAPNVVEHNGAFNRLALGIYRPNDRTTAANSTEETALLTGLGTMIEAGGGTATIHPEIQRVKFTKNFWNVAFSSLATLTQYTLPAIFRPPPNDPSISYQPFVSPKTADLITTYTIPAIQATLEELVVLARALGYPDSEDGIPSSLPKYVIEVTGPAHARPDISHVPSMLLDAQKGLPIEVEAIFGEVVRMAKERNVEIPRIETLYALLLVIQNQILRKTEARNALEYVGDGSLMQPMTIDSLILKRSGLARVTCVARSNFDVINDNGVQFRSRKYGSIDGWMPHRLCKSVQDAADRQYSYVVLTTKAVPDLVKTSQILAPLFSKEYNDSFIQPTYVLLQNGVNVETDLYNALKEEIPEGHPQIISCALWIYTNLLSPNVVEHSDFDRVAIGVYRHQNNTTVVNSADESALLKDFGNILETGGSTIITVPEIQRMKFTKNFWNISFSSIATLTNYTLPAIYRPPPSEGSAFYEPYVSSSTAHLISSYTIPVIRGMLDELVILGRALGYPDTEDGLPSSLVHKVLDGVREVHAKADCTHVPSMLLDAQKGQPIEVEVIVGEVIRMAKANRVDTPRLETLYALLLVVQNQILRKLESEKH
ncbi:hypothetical protein CVT25_015402 [Psilocybe cyanescens]|uniref:Ketopantoate reductase C-terminal domain-containing protein n=1 Tax=Psilocybe cyanescens TaxID=93625 RepID=A0A409WHE5_PSICY|nr:hypothetical protein CVT25_015402 [Psilocybe cyanescens]